MAEAYGFTGDPTALMARSGSFYFEIYTEIVEALDPTLWHIKFTEFSRMEVNAFATRNDGNNPGVKLDQYLDFWLLPLYQLVTLRAFYRIEGDNLAIWQDQFETALMTRFDAHDYQQKRHEFLYLYQGFPEAFRVSHHLGLASLAFVFCHELAHHDLKHFEEHYTPALEYDADARGFEFLQRLYDPGRKGSKLHPRPFSLAGASIFLRLLDISDHVRGWQQNQAEVLSNRTHPKASERFDRIVALGNRNHSIQGDLVEFWNGFGPVCDAAQSELKAKYLEGN